MKALHRALAAAVLLVAFSSCQLPRSTGLAAPFGPTGTGSTTLLVAEGVPALYLAGTVQVDSGQLTVRLVPPHGSATEWTYALGLSPVDQAITSPDAGTWQLGVESVGGTGEYSLRLSY